jgi:hypothetical protein
MMNKDMLLSLAGIEAEIFFCESLSALAETSKKDCSE